jgi:hypothetical protein
MLTYCRECAHVGLHVGGLSLRFATSAVFELAAALTQAAPLLAREQRRETRQGDGDVLFPSTQDRLRHDVN